MSDCVQGFAELMTQLKTVNVTALHVLKQDETKEFLFSTRLTWHFYITPNQRSNAL